ncbi:MAG: NAD(P)H-dependent oxidoreductase [Lentisphaeria bacterium]|nr:NAD(P)H-dependent oxidoreductase [Lentisphaeria bacterium]
MKAVTVIIGHPAAESFCAVLAHSYAQGARDAGAEARVVDLRSMRFDPVLWEGYRRTQELEPDLKAAQEDILWSRHLVFAFPIWWGTPPGLLKGFIDRVFHPSFAFKYDGPRALFQRKLLGGRSGRILCTLDSPPLYYRFVMGAPGLRMMKRSVLGFCGVRPVRSTLVGSVKLADEAKRRRWIDQLRRLGEKEARRP